MLFIKVIFKLLILIKIIESDDCSKFKLLRKEINTYT